MNQVGFLPGAAKWAVVVGGSTGNETVTVRLLDARSGNEVWRGNTSAPATWQPSQDRARVVDFSAFTTAGEYKLQVAGSPDSASFRISEDAYGALQDASLKAFYFNRSGTELLPEHGGAWARALGHADTRVLIHASAAGPRRNTGDAISSAKGWYDAGDYNKYIVNSGISTYTLLAAWEHFPARFETRSTQIPESGNSLPDVLDEALWNLEWVLTMQDPDDGGVYHKLTNLNFDGTVMPDQARNERYVVQKTTAAALNFAAVMAQGSRVFARFEDQQPGLSARMLAAARSAWAWAQANPTRYYSQPGDVRTGEYGDGNVSDEFAWAAAELYITTRDDAFWTAVQATTLPNSVPAWLDVKGLAWTSLAHHRAGLTAAADRTLIEQRVRELANSLSTRWQSSAYRVAMQNEDYVWGSNSVLLNQGLMLVQGYRLTGDALHLAGAQAAMDYALGRNALGMSMVTGFGTRSPQRPHHRPSAADGVTAPVPGFIVGGPHSGQQDLSSCPRGYPSTLSARSYLDDYCSYATNEVAINWNAPLVYLSAALQALTPSASQ